MEFKFSITHTHPRARQIKEIREETSFCRCRHRLRAVLVIAGAVVLARTGHLPPVDELLGAFA